MRKKVIIVSIILAIVLGSLYFLFDYPVVLNSNQDDVLFVEDSAQLEFNPLDNIDFTSGDIVAYLYFDKTDLKELPKEMGGCRIFECRQNTVLKNLKKFFHFRKLNGDMGTCESKIYLYKDDELVFHTSFVLTDNLVGLQSQLTGWSEATNKKELMNVLLKFKPVKRPIVKF